MRPAACMSPRAPSAAALPRWKPNSGCHFVPEALRAFAVDYPGISIDVHAMGSHVVAEAVAEHRVELGILFGTPPRPDLRTLGRMRQPLCAIVSPNHPLARRRGCSLREAAGFPLVLPDRSFGIRQLVERVAARDRITLRPVAETNTLGFAWRLVSHFDDRVTFMPREARRRRVDTGCAGPMGLRGPTALERGRRCRTAAAGIRVPAAGDRRTDGARVQTRRPAVRLGRPWPPDLDRDEGLCAGVEHAGVHRGQDDGRVCGGCSSTTRRRQSQRVYP